VRDATEKQNTGKEKKKKSKSVCIRSREEEKGKERMNRCAKKESPQVQWFVYE